jgi:hypothetical protein
MRRFVFHLHHEHRVTRARERSQHLVLQIQLISEYNRESTNRSFDMEPGQPFHLIELRG